MSAKDIKKEEFPSLKEADTSDNAKIHGVVTCLSPMKKGKSTNFFEATITDDNTEMRVVGFSGSHRKRVADFHEKSESVTLENCKVKKVRKLDDLEVLLKSNTGVHKSPIKFGVSAKSLKKETSPDVSVNDVTDKHKPVYSKVSIRAKVINIEDPVTVKTGSHHC